MDLDFKFSDDDSSALELLRSDLLDCSLVSDDDADYSSSTEGLYRLTLGKYVVTETYFDSPSAAYDWIHAHPVSLVLAVVSICRAVDNEISIPGDSSVSYDLT